MQLYIHDRELGQELRQLSSRFNNRYNLEAGIALTKILFHYLANKDEEHLRLFFPNGPPTSETQIWRLTEVQGVAEGAEYSQAARGRRCGHIFRDGEATYSCRTCATDETCVLCTRCFEASDHEGHQVSVSMSGGASGCCDCEDPEAWLHPVRCSIHTAISDQAMEQQEANLSTALPADLEASIRGTISRVLDFLVDILSCCPEEMKTPKTDTSILEDERNSRLLQKYYGGLDREENEFALVLWNDEKHTVGEVADRVSRACGRTMLFGTQKAHEVDEIGRSVINYSKEIPVLLRQAAELAQIKVTVSIRSSRDLFREEMCGAMVEWLADIAACSVGNNNSILMNVVCEEMLRPWRMGSAAFNLPIAKRGITDHERSDERLENMRRHLLGTNTARLLRLQTQGARQRRQDAQAAAEPIAGEDVPDDEEVDEEVDEEADDIDEVDEEVDVDADEEDEMDLDEDLFEVEATDGNGMALAEEDVDTAVFVMRNGRRFDILSSPLRPDLDNNDMEDDQQISEPEADLTRLFSSIPKTPGQVYSVNDAPPAYWTEHQSADSNTKKNQFLPPHEDLNRRIRIDHLILYDLRMWKQLRTNLKHLYISTVVAIPQFKRILSLRFAALYTHLAQLYLVADREYEHSIINLSLQMLTTPSITAEVVKKGNFLTRLMAILYTFLTKRQVGNPEDVDVMATISFESGVLTNRRIYHFFHDLKYLLNAPFVIGQIRVESKYLLEFLDFAKLYQGICPNTRAVGEHVEYESDAWINASVLVRDVTRLSRQFSEAFLWSPSQDPQHLCRAIRQAARVVIVNSLGRDHERFPQAELKDLTTFKNVQASPYEQASGNVHPHYIVDFVVQNGTISFHHALHYTLSWLIDSGKSMSCEQLRGLLTFQHEHIVGTADQDPGITHEQYLLALFDMPLRVCAWLAQMKAGMWVRNGLTLRHQMSTYRSIREREVSHQRDLFLLQVGFAVLPPDLMLASVIDRFGLGSWTGTKPTIEAEFDIHQVVDVAEEFLHLLVVLLTDRSLLLPSEQLSNPHVSIARQDIINVLCFKPLTFSELGSRLSEKVMELDEFQDIVEDLTTYRPPEGISDSGLLQLKESAYRFIDPYNTYYSKSQREEAEMIFRKYMAKNHERNIEDVFYFPELAKIKSGVFANYAKFSQIPLFSQIISSFLKYVLLFQDYFPGVTEGRLEGLLQIVLHLMLVAVLEDDTDDLWDAAALKSSFVHSLLFMRAQEHTILGQLFMLLQGSQFDGSKARVRFLLNVIRRRKPTAFDAALELSDASEQYESLLRTPEKISDNSALKKKQAMERQAKVMEAFKRQQNEFMENQTIHWGSTDIDESEDDMDTDQNTTEPQSYTYPGGMCILCQEETKEQQLYGTLAYITTSGLFRNTPLESPAYLEEICNLPRDLDRSAEAVRPFGRAGNNLEVVKKADAAGNVVEVERRGLGKGFFMFNRVIGPVVTGCGHVMHYSCFGTYNNATARRHSYQVHRVHPEDVGLREFICPLCKALGNTFLPIIWKPKPSTTIQSLTGEAFGRWLGSLNTNTLDVQGLHQRYVKNAWVSPLAIAMSAPSFTQTETMPLPGSASRPNFRFPSMIRPGQNAPAQELPRTQSPAKPLLVAELGNAYQRLFATIDVNNFMAVANIPYSPIPGESKWEGHQLSQALGFSITAVEIAQRGVESAVINNFVSSVPEQTLTQLRLLSETVTSQIAYHELSTQPKGQLKSIRFAQELEEQLLRDCTTTDAKSWEAAATLLSSDTFIFLTECTVYLIPTLGLDFYPVLRLCYIAEIVKVVAAFQLETKGVWYHALGKETKWPKEESEIPTSSKHAFSAFFEAILSSVKLTAKYWKPDDMFEDLNSRYSFERVVYHLLSKYALVFLRKAALLAHVRYGVEFAHSPTDMETPELVRLCQQLGLPTLDEIIATYLSNTEEGEHIRHRTFVWLQQYGLVYHTEFVEEGAAPIELAHPSIFELVALPHAHDTLNAESIKHRCPTTGGELKDPSICLFCGEFLCTQSSCCRTKSDFRGASGANGVEEGGCYRHSRQCGGSIGMLFNIRKCAILLFHRDRGSFFTAPYLDKHGEVDLGLRRKNQLWLNQKRYDKLFRDMWLSHGVPSAVARKLEAEINTGGWETL